MAMLRVAEEDYRRMAKKRRARKHVPERTCVACRTSRPKSALVRVVRLADGGVVVDETGKRNGRGAYLCRRPACWAQALKRGGLARALRVRLSAEEMASLQAYAATEFADPESAITAPESDAV